MEQLGRKFAGAAIAVVLVAAILSSLVDGEIEPDAEDLSPASWDKAKGSNWTCTWDHDPSVMISHHIGTNPNLGRANNR